MRALLVGIINISIILSAYSNRHSAEYYMATPVDTVNTESPKKEHALKVEAAYTGGLHYNIVGGRKQGFAYLGNIDLILTFDTEKANLWKGGTLFAYGLNNHGSSISELVGDIQGVDNTETAANTKLYQLWYNQVLGNWDFTIGQHDMNSEFANTETGSDFINSSYGMQPDISANIPVSIFPMATMGFIIRWKAKPNLSFLTAIYAGEPKSSWQSNYLNLNLFESEGAVSIFETQYKLNTKKNLSAMIKLGVWNHTISTASHASSNNYGFYINTDFKLYSESGNSEQGLSAFSQLGFVPKDINLVHWYASLGFSYKGLLKKRDDDVIGFAANLLTFNRNHFYENTSIPYRDEANLELFYKINLGSHIVLQPDIQYIINPATNIAYKNALVGSLRFVASI